MLMNVSELQIIAKEFCNLLDEIHDYTMTLPNYKSCGFISGPCSHIEFDFERDYKISSKCKRLIDVSQGLKLLERVYMVMDEKKQFEIAYCHYLYFNVLGLSGSIATARYRMKEYENFKLLCSDMNAISERLVEHYINRDQIKYDALIRDLQFIKIHKEINETSEVLTAQYLTFAKKAFKVQNDDVPHYLSFSVFKDDYEGNKRLYKKFNKLI